MLRVRHEASREAKHTAFGFQIEAVETIKNLEYAAVFHEQGLGKTKIAIDLALAWLEMGALDSVLFVTKKSLVENWQEEIKFHTYLAPRRIGQDRSANYYAFNSPARFYVTHYEACKSELPRLQLFLKTRRVGVICDEAQKIKNPESELAQVLFKLGPSFFRRVVMTGTPIANRPYDIWAIIKFLDGGKALGHDFEEFQSRLDLTNDLATSLSRQQDFASYLGKLFSRIQHFSVRETKNSAGLTLPNKYIATVYVDPEERQDEIYRAFRDELYSVVVRNGVPIVDNAQEVVKRLLRLIQVASNPGLVDRSYAATPAKLPVLESLLDEALVEPDAKAIVWTTFTENADWLARELKRFGSARVHGKLGIDERNRNIRRFKTQDSCRLLIATPGSAKEGLTLTVANYAFFFDRSLSLDDYLQAQDRIHRISQQKQCFVYNLVMRDTVDEWVDELLGAKYLAAKLGVGDITQEEYEQAATYRYTQLLQDLLAPSRSKQAAPST